MSAGEGRSGQPFGLRGRPFAFKGRSMVLAALVWVSLAAGCACPGRVGPSVPVAETRQGLSLRGTPRWAMAARDAVLAFPEAAGTFSCAVNAPITEQETPHLYMLLLKTRNDVVTATGKAKEYYRRSRPFAANGEPSCTPDAEKDLAANGSYPSGHTAIGWAWALVLSEVAPERADAVLARGRAFGESRMVCNVHWGSDVAEWRVVGAATVARLHADPVFRADMEAARAELAAVRAKGFGPQLDCAAEAAAMRK